MGFLGEDDDDASGFFPDPSANSPLVGGLFLIVTNLFLSPAIYLLLEWRDYATALFYYALLIISSLYHTCRAFNKCIVPYVEHQKLDYLFVFTSLIWSITAVGVPHAIHYRKRLTVFVVFFSITTVLVIGGSTAWLIAGVAAGGTGATMIVIAAVHDTPLFKSWRMALLGFALVGVAAIFMYILPSATYDWSHAIWHILSMLAYLAFVFAVFGFKRLTPLISYSDTPPLNYALAVKLNERR